MTLTAARYPDYEAERIMASLGIGWEYYQELSLTKINKQKSLANQARIGASINDETCTVYTEAMKRGDKFPAITLYALGNQYVVADGNHRMVSAEAVGIGSTDAYVIKADTNATAIEIFTYEANARHGLPTSLEARARQAVFLVENANLTLPMAAERMNIGISILQRNLNKTRSNDRAVRLGLSQTKWKNVATATRIRLNAIRSDTFFTLVAELAMNADLTSPEAGQIVKAINQVDNDENEQQKVIDTYTDIYVSRIQAVQTGSSESAAPTKRSGRNIGPRRLLLTVINMTSSFSQLERREHLLTQFTPLELSDYIQRLEASMTYLALVKDTMTEALATDETEGEEESSNA